MLTTSEVEIKNKTMQLDPNIPSKEFKSVEDYAPYKESHIRSILKGITWRVLATSTTIFITYMLVGEIGIALKVGFIEFFGKLLLYYGHERFWQAIPRGTLRLWLKSKFLGK